MTEHCETGGDNSLGQLENGTRVSKDIPTRIGTDSDWKMIFVGYGKTIYQQKYLSYGFIIILRQLCI